MTLSTDNPSACRSTGPKTDLGKTLSARNATSHGLFARDIVLPHLGEDPEGYNRLLQELTEQIKPKNLLDQHYLEVIAASSWRLRRLQRWQAVVFEDASLSDDERFNKLDRVQRHETTLLRQIDKAVHQLGRDAVTLFISRARAEALAELKQTEAACAAGPDLERQVELLARERVPAVPLPPEFDLSSLDVKEVEKCQNELPAPPDDRLPPMEAVKPNGCPVYLGDEDVEYLRRLLSGKDKSAAKYHVKHCRERYQSQLRQQELTLPVILSSLGLSPAG